MINRCTITVLMGGPSSERLISLKSGLAVVDALFRLGFNVYSYDPLYRKLWVPSSTDVVFIALHGEYGEDGQVQRELERLGVTYTGSGPEASLIGFNKVLSKQRFKECGIPTPEYVIIEKEIYEWPSGWAPPVVLKPATQGSSIGVVFVEKPEDLQSGLKEAGQYGWPVIMEKKITGRELTVGILDTKPLPVIEIKPKNGDYFSYNAKYTKGATEYNCPACLPKDIYIKVQEVALSAFNAIGGRDFGRVDIMLDLENQPYVLEVNTIPGLTETSLLPKAAMQVGYDFDKLCLKIVEMALTRK